MGGFRSNKKADATQQCEATSTAACIGKEWRRHVVAIELWCVVFKDKYTPHTHVHGTADNHTSTRETFPVYCAFSVDESSTSFRARPRSRRFLPSPLFREQMSMIFILGDLMNKRMLHPVSSGVFLLSASYCVARLRRQWARAGESGGAKKHTIYDILGVFHSCLCWGVGPLPRPGKARESVGPVRTLEGY